jgi:hypothetical protein
MVCQHIFLAVSKVFKTEMDTKKKRPPEGRRFSENQKGFG